MYLTKPLSKMLSNLLKLIKLNVFTDVPSRKSMYPQREISRNYWAWCPTLAGKKKREKKIPSLVTYLILNQRNYIFTIILIMVGEIYSLSKSSSLSKYTIVYSKVWQKLFFVENVFIGSTFAVPHLRKKETLKSSLHMKYLSRNWKHHFISS